MTAFPDPRFVETNGIRMAFFEQGDGPPVVFCHGFPELAYSWRHQLPAVGNAGFRAIAPDQRGYGRTDRPKEIEAYDIHHLTVDLVGLLDALKIEKAVLCGHDWGGAVTWRMPLMYPDRIAGVIGVNTPFRPRPNVDPIQFLRDTMGEENYVVFFQQPGVADAMLNKDVARSLRFMYRRSWITLEANNELPDWAKNLALFKAFEAPEETWGGTPLLTDEEFATYFAAFKVTGFTGGLNWYRNVTRNWKTTEGLAEHIDVPCLMISAADDLVLRPELTQGMENYIPDLEKHVIPDCGHWTQSEQPEALNQILIDWLRRRFG